MFKQILFALSFIFLVACNGRDKRSIDDYSEKNKLSSEYQIRYAKGFEVYLYDSCKVVIVKDPWNPTSILQTYVLVDKDKPLPNNLPQGTLVRTPLSDVLAYSTIHCSTIEELGMLATIKGVCDPQYIEIPSVKQAIVEGNISNLGQATNPDQELMLEIEPEAVFIEPMQGKTTASVQNLGILVIETPDYMEASPLGRAEWIRFYSLFYKKEALADSLFEATVKNYERIKSTVASVDYRPTVFFDIMYRGVWYTAGGKSSMADMVSDAGATYIWKDDNGTDAKQLSFEQVLDKASSADIWLIKNYAPYYYTYKSLANEYPAYGYFDAYKNKNIYLANTANCSYYQDLPIHPDYILQDLAYVFHPELFPDYTPKYYVAMQ